MDSNGKLQFWCKIHFAAFLRHLLIWKTCQLPAYWAELKVISWTKHRNDASGYFSHSPQMIKSFLLDFEGSWRLAAEHSRPNRPQRPRRAGPVRAEPRGRSDRHPVVPGSGNRRDRDESWIREKFPRVCGHQEEGHRRMGDSWRYLDLNPCNLSKW